MLCLLILKAVAEKGFDVAGYLKDKQHSLVIAIEGEEKLARNRKERTPRERKPKKMAEEKEKWL